MRTIRAVEVATAGSIIAGAALAVAGVALHHAPICLTGVTIFGVAAMFAIWFPWGRWDG